MKRLFSLVVSTIVMVWAVEGAAEIRMPAVFASNMVLQRGIDVPVWGWETPGEEVTVNFNGQSVQAVADTDGKWDITFASMNAGGPYDMTITGNDTIVLGNVMVGEVWVCSGQSNMEMRVRHIRNAKEEVGSAYHPNIRLFQMKNSLDPEPQEDCVGTWEVCRPSTVGGFSAAGYFFGRKLHEELDVPIGLIHASWGGTTIETWMSPGAVNRSEDYRQLLERWESTLAENPDEIIEFYHKCEKWEEDIHHAIYGGKPFPDTFGEPPARDIKLIRCPHMPSWVNNAMIAPLVPYAIRGAIWYQGESNSGRAYQYRSLFPDMIEDWRAHWGQGDFPFIYVQLANFKNREDRPSESAWAELREAQLLTLAVPNTAMAVAIDVGEADDVHPRNKQDVGLRLALGALGTVYGKDIVSSGPLYDSMSVEGSRIRLRFTDTGSGMMAKENGSLSGFAIASADKKFVWADAKIDGEEIVVWSGQAENPIAVRYGWANNPDCNLYNKEGLPASPFRTDDWDGVTKGK